jgi:endonuclease YncB( thermonuclease family)
MHDHIRCSNSVRSALSPRLDAHRLWMQTLLLSLLIFCLPTFAQTWVTPALVEPGSTSKRLHEAPFEARLQHLSDGDSFVVRAQDGRRVPVRLLAIDAPEKNQPHGDESRRSLRTLLENRPLTIVPIKTDPYGRTVARVLVGETDAGLEQVRAGMAWHYKRYESDQSPRERREYAQAEAKARLERLGLWIEDEPVPPWRFREQQRRGQRLSDIFEPVTIVLRLAANGAGHWQHPLRDYLPGDIGRLCRSVSYKTMPAATDTLRLST